MKLTLFVAAALAFCASASSLLGSPYIALVEMQFATQIQASVFDEASAQLILAYSEPGSNVAAFRTVDINTLEISPPRYPLGALANIPISTSIRDTVNGIAYFFSSTTMYAVNYPAWTQNVIVDFSASSHWRGTSINSAAYDRVHDRIYVSTADAVIRLSTQTIGQVTGYLYLPAPVASHFMHIDQALMRLVIAGNLNAATATGAVFQIPMAAFSDTTMYTNYTMPAVGPTSFAFAPVGQSVKTFLLDETKKFLVASTTDGTIFWINLVDFSSFKPAATTGVHAVSAFDGRAIFFVDSASGAAILTAYDSNLNVMHKTSVVQGDVIWMRHAQHQLLFIGHEANGQLAFISFGPIGQ